MELWSMQLEFYLPPALKYYPGIPDEICRAGHILEGAIGNTASESTMPDFGQSCAGISGILAEVCVIPPMADVSLTAAVSAAACCANG